MAEKPAAHATDNIRLTARVTGAVQGVGFRYWTARRAAELELTGTATNQFDGSVEVIAEGPAVAVVELQAWLNSSEPPGKVDDVASFRSPATGSFRDFRVV
ncbi:acylphosphatase [Paeniglutamicibacter antarcticus]|uniref:acylphosphatase n=1 Tax=Arthrobacter terrae TaxID=2935737 RepID=A0A931G3L4_9MICC|nr:acylphosphatase [Arthrobacter terrae]MBG0737848.1 acylphosphatase [Arthrobacter terrae]